MLQLTKKFLRFITLFVILFSLFLPQLFGQEKELDNSFSTEDITTRIYRSSDNLNIDTKKMSFGNSIFKNDVINKNDLLYMLHKIKPIKEESKKDSVGLGEKNNLMPWFLSGLMLGLLYIIFRLLNHFKV